MFKPSIIKLSFFVVVIAFAAPALGQSAPLRELAEKRGIVIGTAVSIPALRSNAEYAKTLAREFKMVTPENAMKFGPIHPAPDRYAFDGGDALVEFAQAHRMQVRGHTLVWHEQLPDWVKNGKFSNDELRQILQEHIRTVVGHYRGKIAQWDVVNEAIDDRTNSLRDTVWRRALGDDYIEFAFRCAHEADPQAKLFYNDYGGEALGKKSDAIYAMVKAMKQRGVPIDGVGLQMHVKATHRPGAEDLRANIERLIALGLEVAVTELDVAIDLPADEAKLRAQADVYREIMNATLANEHCRTFVMWGFTDRYSWISANKKGEGAALVFDESFGPKPAYRALAEALFAP